MTFKIQDLKKPTINTELTKTLQYEGLELTLCIKNDPAFMNALSRVGGAMNAEKVLDKNSLKRENNGMQSSEALLFVIGEYAVSEWNVADNDDKPIAINGENFTLVLESVPNLADFLVVLINEFNKLLAEFSEQVEEIKKKSLKPLNGKK